MKKPKKLCALLVFVLILSAAGVFYVRHLCYRHEFPYYSTDCSYTPDKVRLLFAEDRETFDRLARIMLENDDAYLNGRNEYETTFQMHGSTYGKYARYFTDEETGHIREFFSEHRPSSLYRRYNYVGFVFSCADSGDDLYSSVSLLYAPDSTELRKFRNLEELGDGWHLLDRL